MQWPKKSGTWLALALGLCVAGGCVTPAPEKIGHTPPPAAWLTFDGDCRERVSGKNVPQPVGATFVPGRSGQALHLGTVPATCPTPEGFEWDHGSVDLWVRPEFECRDNTYHFLFDVAHPAKGRAYLLKSGKGGANGLFLCVVDANGTWMAASVFPGRGYDWKPGEWHRIGGAWDGPRGLIKLFFDGEEVKTTQTAPWTLGPMGAEFAIGGAAGGGQMFDGAVKDFRLAQNVPTQTPIAWAKNVRGPQRTAWRAIDGDTDDLASWDGKGAPNWIAVELPDVIRLAQVIVFPGALRYAPYPSTECSPRRYVIQGWVKGTWRDIATPVNVPRYRGEGIHRIVTDLPHPTVLRRFRLFIPDIYDSGCRVSSPKKPIVPPGERSVVIREIQWLSEEEIVEARQRLAQRRAAWAAEFAIWRRQFAGRDAAPVTEALRKTYGARFARLDAERLRLTAADRERVERLAADWAQLQRWLAPWADRPAAGAMSRKKNGRGRAFFPDRRFTGMNPMAAPLTDNGPPQFHPVFVGRLDLVVDAGKTPHEFYPAAMALDLNAVEAALGCAVDPVRMQMVEMDDAGKPIPFAPDRTGPDRFQVPHRFDRITPKRGFLRWTLRDRTLRRFAVFFQGRANGPSTLGGNITLGCCDHFYYDTVAPRALPGNVWAASFADWDRDGRPDLIAGRWTDYCHVWRNIGTANKPSFIEPEHWRVIDTSDRPIVANAEHPGLGFSIPMPIDFDGDRQLDIFLQTYYGEIPKFYRGLRGKRGDAKTESPAGPRPPSRIRGTAAAKLAGSRKAGAVSGGFPIVQKGVSPVGLLPGRVAFGKLDGDGTPDAVVVQRTGGKDAVLFQRGEGLSVDGRPVFGAPRRLDLTFERNPAGSTRTVPALADIDADGDLDLFLCCAPRVWFFENIGSAKVFRFPDKPTPLKRNGKPLTISDYYLWISWADWDGDGDLDLIKSTGLTVYLNEGTPKNPRLGKRIRPTEQRQMAMGRSGLRAHAMKDWDGDGDLDHIVLGARGLDLRVSLWDRAKGLFHLPVTVPVDPNKRDWFGCPDPGEYYALYGNVRLVDWDGDGDLDLFVTSEHSWRFGYIHYYENLGNHRFGPEIEMHPHKRHEYVSFVPGKQGKAALVDQHAWVDFLSFRTNGHFDPAEGVIRFDFQPHWKTGDHGRRTFFCTRQHPETYGISASDIRFYLQGRKPELGQLLRPPFALVRTVRNTLRFQAGSEHIETKPLDWKPGEWHGIEVSWGAKGSRIRVDGAVAAESALPVKPRPVGARLHIGSNQTFMIQRLREYASRRKYHPKDWTFIADGAFDNFEIRDAMGKALLTLPFDGNCDATQGVSGGRTTIGYRCTPGFADLTGDGLPDMVMMLNDGTRFNPGLLYLFRNVGTKHKPKLDDGTVLQHVSGLPFRCHVRTEITPVDWDRDGRIDLILSSENCGQPFNAAVDFFRNVGTPTRPVFALRQPMHRLNAMLEAHHEIKLCAVDLTGNGAKDLVTSTDPGTRVVYRSYLDEAPVRVRITGSSMAFSKP